MKIKGVLLSIMLLNLLPFVLITSYSYAEPNNMPKTITGLCDEYESKINNQIRNEKYVKAICTVAEYEQALFSKYSPSTFELGLFQNEAHHISFHSSFDNWSEESLKDSPEWLSSVGFYPLIKLENKTKTDSFLMFSTNLHKKLKKRFGLSVSTNTRMSDGELQMNSNAIAANFGVVKNQEFKTIGDHRILVLNIGTPKLGISVVLACLSNAGQSYFFLLVSSAGNRTENEKRLYDLIKTVSFTYKPADTVKINIVRKKITEKTNIIQLLNSVRELALAGEYGEAGDVLSMLCLAISEEMPKVKLNGNIASHSAYGLRLTNPNPSKWSLSVGNQGGIDMIILEDRFSVNQAGILIGAINTVLLYGSHAADITGENVSERERKGFLSSAGRGGLMNMGATIESERFRIFKKLFVYEGIGSPNIPNTKVKALWMFKPGYAIMVIMFIDAANFKVRSAEYEALLDKYFQIETR